MLLTLVSRSYCNLRITIDELIVSTEGQYSEEQYSKLRRKADFYLLPLMWLCYGIQQTDKTAIGTQATFGMRADTHLVGQQYSWLTTIFCVLASSISLGDE